MLVELGPSPWYLEYFILLSEEDPFMFFADGEMITQSSTPLLF